MVVAFAVGGMGWASLSHCRHLRRCQLKGSTRSKKVLNEDEELEQLTAEVSTSAGKTAFEVAGVAEATPWAVPIKAAAMDVKEEPQQEEPPQQVARASPCSARSLKKKQARKAKKTAESQATAAAAEVAEESVSPVPGHEELEEEEEQDVPKCDGVLPADAEPEPSTEGELGQSALA